MSYLEFTVLIYLIISYNGMKYSGDYTEITEILAYIQALKSNYFRLS